MPVRGSKEVRRNFKMKLEEIAGPKTEAALFAILREGAALSAIMTPVDTSNLINSLTSPEISKGKNGTKGKVGYTARYAKAVHDASGKLKGQPRADFGKTGAGVSFGGGTGKGNYWDPAGEPKFLEKGFEQIKPAIPQILKKIYG